MSLKIVDEFRVELVHRMKQKCSEMAKRTDLTSAMREQLLMQIDMLAESKERETEIVTELSLPIITELLTEIGLQTGDSRAEKEIALDAKKPNLPIIEEFKTKDIKQIGRECYDIAIANNFVDDFDTFVGHIFGNSDFKRFFLTDEEETIKGFSVIEFQKIKDIMLCYIGIVFLHPSVQGHGFSKELMTFALANSGVIPHIKTLRTHNPRMFTASVSTFRDLWFPNPIFEIPVPVWDSINSLPCAKDLDHDLIVREVYNDEFVQQSSRGDFSRELFAKVGLRDGVMATSIDSNMALGMKLRYRSK